MALTLLALPLIAALVAGLLWRSIGETAVQAIACGLSLLAALLAWTLFFAFDGTEEVVVVARFLDSGTLSADWAIRLDTVSLGALVLITSLAAVTHIYSFDFLQGLSHLRAGEPYHARLIIALNLLSFAMLVLVVSDNLLQMAVAFGGITLGSTLLVGFFGRKPTANRGALKLAIIHRIGDLCALLGVIVLFLAIDTISLDVVFEEIDALAAAEARFLGATWSAANLAATLFALAAMSKAGQLGLHIWASDAMESPSSTWVATFAYGGAFAGGFLIVRLEPVFSVAASASVLLAWSGVLTAVFAGAVAAVQTDVRKVLGFVAIGQFGIIFAGLRSGSGAVGLADLAMTGLGLGLVLLGAGVVTRGLSGLSDLRQLGGVSLLYPLAGITTAIGAAALMPLGIPGTGFGLSGFGARGASFGILQAAPFAGSAVAVLLIVVASGLLSFALWRMVFLTFLGERRGEKDRYQAALPTTWATSIALIALATIVVVADVVMSLNGAYARGDVIGGGLVLLSGLAGLGAAWFAHSVPTAVAPMAERIAAIAPALKEGLYIDAVLTRIATRPFTVAGTLLRQRGDGRVIDGGLNAAATGAVPLLARSVAKERAAYTLVLAFVAVMFVVFAITLTAMQ